MQQYQCMCLYIRITSRELNIKRGKWISIGRVTGKYLGKLFHEQSLTKMFLQCHFLGATDSVCIIQIDISCYLPHPVVSSLL